MNPDAEFGIGWHNAIFAVAERSPEKPAIIGPDFELNFRQLTFQVERWASGLADSGVRSGQVVMVRLPRELDIIATLALSLLGAISVSNTGKQFLGFESNSRWLISRVEVADYPSEKQILVNPPWVQRVLNGESIRATLAPANWGFAKASDTARLVLTSGTTGKPKGVIFSTETLVKRMSFDIADSVEIASTLTLMDMGTVAGGTRAVGELRQGRPYLTLGNKNDPRQLVQLSRKVPIERLVGSPAQLQGLIENFLNSPFDFSHLKAVRSTGAVTPLPLQNLVREKFGIELFVSYASTEAGFAAGRPAAESDDPSEMGNISPSCELQIVDDLHTPLGIGVPGQVRYRTDRMSGGYFNDAAATEAAFRDGWFYPGDVGVTDTAGRLKLVGRVAELINLGGVKVAPDEVERKLAARFNIGEFAVCGAQLSDGRMGLVVAVVGSVGRLEKQIQKYVARELRLTDQVLIKEVTELPRNAMGKVSRSQLSERFAAK